MSKRIAMLLCTAVLTLAVTMSPAMASADPFIPIEVEAYTYGPFDEPRVNKVYQLSVADDPSGISTEDFERGGRRYYLLDMTAANTDSETVTYTAVFGSAEFAGRSGQHGHQSLHTETDAGLSLPLILNCAVMAAFCAVKAKQM